MIQALMSLLQRRRTFFISIFVFCFLFITNENVYSFRNLEFEGTEVYLGITRGTQRIDIYVDSLVSDDEELSKLKDLLIWDLEFSGFFRASSKKEFSNDNPIIYIFDGVWTKDNNIVQLEGIIKDAESGEVIMSSTFAGPYSQRRTQVHRYANFIIEQLLGEKSPFPSNIVFASTRGGGYSIMITDFDGYNQKSLFNDENISISPALCPNIKKLAYVSYKGGQPHVYLRNLETGKEKNITPNFDHAGAPAFSPNGDRIAFAATKESSTNIYIYNIETSSTSTVTNHWAIDTQPSFSPTGNELSFTSDRSGSPQVYIVNADGTMPTRISWAGHINEDSSWSPDGTRIAYASYRHGGYKVIIKDIISGDERVVPYVQPNNESPSWSPDGRILAYESGLGSKRQVNIINTETLTRYQITSNGSNFSPKWSF